MTFEYKDYLIDYTMKRSNRKSIELQLQPGGHLLIKGPKTLTEDHCEQVIKRKWDWLVSHMDKLTRHIQERTYDSKESLEVLGERIELVILRQGLTNPKMKVLDREWILVVPREWSRDHVEAYLMEVLKLRLKQHLKKRINHYQKHFTKKVKNISVRNQATKWGSCSSACNLNFNYKLALAPLDVIDYLVVHEMSHLDHMNHSKSFWAKVYQVMPDYREKEAWLKAHGHQLSLRYRYE